MIQYSWHYLDLSCYQDLDARIKEKTSSLDVASFRTMKRLVDTLFEIFSLVLTDFDGFDNLEKSRFVALFALFGRSWNPCKDQKGRCFSEANFTSVELLLDLL